jgi:hypothetical protein
LPEFLAVVVLIVAGAAAVLVKAVDVTPIVELRKIEPSSAIVSKNFYRC